MDNHNRQSDQIAAVKELIKGQESMAQLGVLLRDDAAGKLVEEVKSSISRALAVLGSKAETCSSSSSSAAGVGGGRGDYRKRRQASQLRTVVSKTIIDEYSWRKYGQKKIYKSMFPRGYYRCTHKYDQGCKAIKQVQKSEDDPSLFQITYLGNHTCTRLINGDPNLVSGSTPSETSIISFGSNTSDITKEAPLPSSSFLQQTQQECDHEEVLSTLNSYETSMIGQQLYPVTDPRNETPCSHRPQRDEVSALHCPADNLDASFMIDSLQFADDVLNPDFFDWVDAEPH